MPIFKLQATVDSTNLIDYGLFTVMDKTTVDTLINLNELEASDKLLNLKVRTILWSGYSRKGTIGYGNIDSTNLNGIGLTEVNAYTAFIENFKDKERKFKKIFPLTTLSQSQYDAMLDLYVATGSFNFAGTPNRQFNLTDYIKNRQWDYIATAMTLCGADRLSRQADAKILMLGDYGVYKIRSLIKEQGIQTLVKEYSAGQLTTAQTKQAEYIYYAETKRFLPNMTENRKRTIVTQLS